MISRNDTMIVLQNGTSTFIVRYYNIIPIYRAFEDIKLCFE